MALALYFRSPDAIDLLYWPTIGIVVGFGAFFYGFKFLQRRRLILDTPLSRIRSASLGLVEISGLATGPYTMSAPLSALPCYYYRTVAWEWKRSGKDKKWVKIVDERMHLPFYVDDNTGQMLVDPRDAELDLHCDFQDEFTGGLISNWSGAPANLSRFLVRHGVRTTNKLKVEEYCIKPKNMLFILGTVAENDGLAVSPEPIQDPTHLDSESPRLSGETLSALFGSAFQSEAEEPDEHTGAAHVIQLSSSSPSAKPLDITQQRKVAGALVKAGISSLASWNAGGITASSMRVFTAPEVTEGRGRASGSDPEPFDLHPAAVLKKGSNDKTFLISWRSQRAVARTLGWKSAGLIWGGALLAIISVYYFLDAESLLK